MPNALIHETSPYLLQHAGNPVDWLPWGEAAFERARAADKLVFLSIGYSTCHWCHVMEHESFEDPQVAGVMNHHFINIKVDREERPDIDATYMAYVQATTGHGGWPMSVWLTPDGKPVFGGTYFPPTDRHGRAGFPRVCHELARLWRDDRERMESSARDAMAHLRQQEARGEGKGGKLPDARVFGGFIDRCEALYDAEHGGFGGSPKFPRPVVPRALMQMADRFGLHGDDGAQAWDMCRTTLRAMASGGMRDHLGGGFHRYSVDRWWHVPHYEKMLYDQAQLAMAYLDGWQLGGEEEFKEVAAEIFHYLMTSMRDSAGAFHAAEDADSLPSHDAVKKREGAYWTWTAAEISELLDPREAAIFHAAYGVEANGNARPESDPHGELDGQNTLFRAKSDAELAALFDCTECEIRTQLEAARLILMKHRGTRPAPHRDDKIITAWNGLAIGALARGARVLGRADLAGAAREAAVFLQRESWDGTRLFRSHRQRRGDAEGFAADYVFLISGLIELHAALPGDGWLAWAAELQTALDRHCWSDAMSGYVMRPSLAGEELMEIRDDYDGAEPSPNHLAAENLLKLAVLLDEPRHAARAELLLSTGARMLDDQPFACPQLLAALDLHDRGVMHFKIPAAADARTLAAIHSKYLPRAVFSPADGDRIIVCEGTACRPFDG
jgi:hypothetical protein